MSPNFNDTAPIMKLPPAYTSITEVLNLESNRDGVLKEIKPWSYVSVVGVVIDRMEPFLTSNDWKATVRLIDLSTDQAEGDTALEVHMFYQEEQIMAMPKANSGDILIAYNVKVQSRNGNVSVVTNKSQTKFALYTASKIPKPPSHAGSALVPFPPKHQKKPDSNDALYASYLRAHISGTNVPAQDDFIQMTVQSKNTKEKFRELKDVINDSYSDLVVQVVRDPFEGGIATTLWVSDYTSNPAFHNFSDSNVDSASDSCPRGQISMQISCFDEHAEHIRESRITKGTWISMKNVRIRYNTNGSNLEGFLRGFEGDARDRGANLKISILHVEFKEDLSPRHEAALKRCRDYVRAEKNKDQQVEDAVLAGRKRKASGVSMDPQENSKENSKAKRRLRREAQRLKEGKQEPSKHKPQPGEGQPAKTEMPPQAEIVTAKDPSRKSPTTNKYDYSELAVQAVAPLHLNAAVKCENHQVPPQTVAVVTQDVTSTHDVGGDQKITVPLPFINRKYRMNVRVRDFYPPDLKEFARRKRIRAKVAQQFDLLSNDGESDLDVNSDDIDDGEESAQWEWCFWLELVDTSKQSFWVLIDNPAGECLTNLDAVDLEVDKEALQSLRENLFILWGDLEDHKPAIDAAAARDAKMVRKGRKGEAPPPHSDDDDDDDGRPVTKVSNRFFSCCVEQYGIKVEEKDPEKVNAGNGRRWQRIYKLFGTRTRK